MDGDYGPVLQKELSNIALRLMHAERTHIEKADELIEEVKHLNHELHELKAELLALGDLLLALSPQSGKTAP